MSRRNEAQEMIHDLVDGTISNEDFAVLQEILMTDAGARRDYFNLTTTDQLLVDNYRQPDLLGHHVEPDRGSWTARHMRGKKLFWSLGAAAAILVLSLSALWMIVAPDAPVLFSSSADSRLLIEGQPPGTEVWRQGETLEVKSGVALAKLNRETEACISGPASLVLLEEGGDVEMRRGRVFFRIADGAPDFKIHVAGATVRHIGTEFGIRAIDGNSGEVHVATGSVEIDRLDGKKPLVLGAGEAASWMNGQATERIECDLAPFLRSLPTEVLVFSDDFSEPKGTMISGKKPDVGEPWRVLGEKNPTTAGAGELDTSGGFRKLTTNFRIIGDPDHYRRVVLMSFATQTPRRTFDKVFRVEGTEGITLWDLDGKPICSVSARAKDGHRWRLVDHMSNRESELTSISALESNQLTLRYDTLTGRITLHAGPTAQAEVVAEVSTANDAVAACLTVSNDEGGDLALTQLNVHFVNYQEKQVKDE